MFTGPLAPEIMHEKSDLPGSQGLGSRGAAVSTSRGWLHGGLGPEPQE